VFYRTPASISFQWAVWSRHKQRFDVNYDDYHALFTGKPIVPATQRKPPFWRTNKPMNQLIFGMQHINKDTIRAIIEKLNDAPLVFYTGYPSIIYQIATTAVAAGLNMMAGPKVIFTGAEPLHEFQRNVIEAFFGCLVTDQYGTSEGVANASKCPEGNYHVDFEMGYLEVAPDDIGDDPATGELLMTGFTNLGMPLIRYAIGDRGKLSRGSCACGRHSPVLSKLEGRSEDYVLTPEGNKITRFDYIYKGVNGLEEAQVIQRKAGEIDILLVTNTEFTSDEQRKILEALTRYVSPTLEVHFKVVNDIPRTRSGKFRAVINQL
jgi:phenylacetate-CoA ligase